MSSPIDGPSANSLPQAGSRSRRSLLGWAMVLVAAILGIGWGYLVWLRATAPTPPEVELSHSDAEVVEAVEEARRLVKKYPHHPAAWGRLGMTLHAHDYYSQAVTCYAHAEKLDRTDARWPYLQAICASQLGSDEIIPCLERSIQCRTTDSVCRSRLGEFLLEQGRIDEADAQFEEVLRHEPGNARAHLGRGRVAVARGNHRDGLTHLEQAIAREQSVSVLYTQLAASYHALGETKKADEARRRASQLDQERSWVDPYLAQVVGHETGLMGTSRRAAHLFRSGQKEEACALLHDLAEKHPKSALVRAGLGRLLFMSNKPTDAIPHLEEALRLDPNLAEPLYYLGLCFAIGGKFDDAAKAYRRSIELQPTRADAHYELARALYRLGDLGGATKAARESLRYKPNSVRGLQDLGNLLAEQGEYEEALTHLTEASKLAPEDKEIARRLQRVRQLQQRAKGQKP